MRLCRFEHAGRVGWGIFQTETIVATDRWIAEHLPKRLAQSGDLSSHSMRVLMAGLEHGFEAALPIDSAAWQALTDLVRDAATGAANTCPVLQVSDVRMLPPIARPPKLLLLAGNYAEHVREQGGTSAEKERTFPYVFMKPPSTTLRGSGERFTIPTNSPSKLDHEVELGVVIGRTARNLGADRAATIILGYTIINDLSDRGFRPNPGREVRPRDTFFDWLHGKWHDGSCPCGPCLVTTDSLPDPHSLQLSLSIDGQLRQQGSTGQMIFSVYELIEFISSFMTLEPGDIISTGTPSGVGNASGRYLQPGTTMVASIEGIGQLTTPIAG